MRTLEDLPSSVLFPRGSRPASLAGVAARSGNVPYPTGEEAAGSRQTFREQRDDAYLLTGGSRPAAAESSVRRCAKARAMVAIRHRHIDDILCTVDAVTLVRAHPSDVNLEAADLTRANLAAANLRGANLFGTNLDSSFLTLADLYTADLRQTSLTDAHEVLLQQNGREYLGRDLTWRRDRLRAGWALLSRAAVRRGILLPSRVAEQQTEILYPAREVSLRTSCRRGGSRQLRYFLITAFRLREGSLLPWAGNPPNWNATACGQPRGRSHPSFRGSAESSWQDSPSWGQNHQQRQAEGIVVG
jgi:hypothetical protein